MLCDSLGFIVPSLKEGEQPSDVESGSSKTVRAGGDRTDTQAGKQALMAQGGNHGFQLANSMLPRNPYQPIRYSKYLGLLSNIIVRLAHKGCASFYKISIKCWI